MIILITASTLRLMQVWGTGQLFAYVLVGMMVIHSTCSFVLWDAKAVNRRFDQAMVVVA